MWKEIRRRPYGRRQLAGLTVDAGAVPAETLRSEVTERWAAGGGNRAEVLIVGWLPT